jgi:peptidoglycan-associated lipoprotein
MRIALLAPLITVFGCAHEASATASTETTAAPTPVATAEPPAAVAPQEEVAAATKEHSCATQRVHFRLDSAVIEENQKPVLDTVASCLQSNPKQSVVIEGNADERGSIDYNLGLGQKRADAVAQYLQDKGAETKQLRQIVSYGEENPLCMEDDESCWKMNRRTAVRASCPM